MKKILTLALCAALLAVFTGCTTTPAPAPTAQPTDTPSSSAAPTDAPDASPDASPDAAPDGEPAGEPSQQPTDSPDGQGGAPNLTVQEGTYGYSLSFDPAAFTFANLEGVDKYTPLNDETKETAATLFHVSKLAKDAVSAYEAEMMGEDKQAVLIGTGSYAANMGVATETAEDGSTVTRSYYTVALESGEALCIEIVRVGDTYKDALDAMLASLTLK